MRRHRDPHERAFTMVEMIVGMVLLAIAVGLVGSALVQALDGSASSTSGATSDTAVARVVARFQDDLAVVETADRSARLVREQVSLDAALRTDKNAPSDDPATPKASVDLEDVLIATPTRFRVQADVDRTRAGAECVTWERVISGNKYSIVRSVQGQGCVGATETEVLITGRTDAANAVITPFSYRLICNRALCPGSLATSKAPCGAWVATSATTRGQRRWIVGVQAQFVANSGRDATRGSSGATMSIRSREEHMWRTALGC